MILQDRHGVGNRLPVEDLSQDYELLAGWKNETHLGFRMSRLLVTCDGDDIDLNV